MRLSLIRLPLVVAALLAPLACASLDFAASDGAADLDTGLVDGDDGNGDAPEFLALSWGVRGTLDVAPSGAVGVVDLVVVGRDEHESCEATAQSAEAEWLDSDAPLINGVDAWLAWSVVWTPNPGCPSLGTDGFVLGFGPPSPSLLPVADALGLGLDGAYGVSLRGEGSSALLFGLAVRRGDGASVDDTDLPGDTDVPGDTDPSLDTDLPGDTDPDTDVDPAGDTDLPGDSDPPDPSSDTDVDDPDPEDLGPIASGRYELHTLFGLPVDAR